MSLNAETEAPGLITALSIGSFDQTKEVEAAQHKEAEAQAAAQKLENDRKGVEQAAAAKIATEENAKKKAAQKAAALQYAKEHPYDRFRKTAAKPSKVTPAN